jgi:hypothetical protein
MLRKIKPREILEPVTRSPHRAAIAAAVEKVVARRREYERAKGRSKKAEMLASGKVASGATPEYDAVMQRLILSPLEIGSRTPEEFRAAVRATSAAKALRAKKPTVKGSAAKKQATKKTFPKTL